MINANPTPPVLIASPILDAFEIAFGDPLIFNYGKRDEFKFPDATEVTIRKDRNMSMTPVSGRDGTIKQQAGHGDAMIDISCSLIGFVYSGTLTNPFSRDGFNLDFSDAFSAIQIDPLLTQMKQLYKLVFAEKAITITNDRLNTIGISQLVIRSLDVPTLETYWEQPIRLSCVEDSHYDIVDLRGQEPDLIDSSDIDAEADAV